MEAYLPSEVARLVLGYLEEVKCTNTWETFLVESPHLQEYYQLHQQGIKYAANINGKSLLGILQEYRSLRGGSFKQSGTQCSCNKTSTPLNSENYVTPNKSNRNKFTKFQVNQKIQTQSVVASLKYGQNNVSSSRRLFSTPETPHHVNICKTPKRRMGVHVTALNFGPEAHTVQINDERNCKSTTDKVNVHLHGNNLRSSTGYSVPTVSGCVSEPDLRICHRTVQTEPLSNSLADLNAGNHNLQSEQPSASDTVELNNSENVADSLPVQSDVANTGSSVCNIIESSPTCSATESCEELGGSSSKPAGPFLTEQLNLESSTKIVSTDDQISIIKQSLVCTSSEVTTCSENVVVTATVENSATPQYIAEPPTYNRAPSTNSPRLILSYDRSQIASLTTPMKDKRYLEEFYSPKRKGFIPRRRLLSESPLPKQVQGNDRTSLAIHEDWFLDFNGTDTLAQIIAENINKEVKSNEELVKDSDGSNSSTYPSLQDINGSVDVIKNVLARTEADPVVDDFLSYLCNSRDSFEVNLTPESAANSAQNNTFKGDDDVTKDSNCIPGSAEDKKSDKQAAVNPSSVENAVNYVSSITNEEGDKLSELSSSAEKSTLPDNNTFSNLPSTQNNDQIENTDVSIQNTDVPVQNTDAINSAENTDKLPTNVADSAVDSAHNGDDDDNDSVVELAVISPQKHNISKSIDAPAKIFSAPGLLTKEVNTQNEDSKIQSVDIADSCYNILNEHKSKCPQCHSEELVTNIVTVNTTDNDSWKALQESCPNCHYQQLGKNNENNSSVQMCLSSSKQIINTEARALTAVSADSNDIHLYGNQADKNKFLVDNFHDKQMVTGMTINQMLSNSVAPSAVENVSIQATVCGKAVNNIVSNVGNTSKTFQEISTSVPSVQTVTLGVPCQNVNNSVPASTVLQWPYSAVPTIFVSNNLPNVLPNILPNPNACQYQIIFKPDSNQTSGNASNVILPLQPISSINQVPNTYLPLPKDMGASNVAVNTVDGSKPEYRTVRKLVFIPSSTNPSETNKRKQEVENEPAPKKRAYNVQEKKSSKPAKQCRKYNKRRKSRSLFPSNSSDSPNKNCTQKSKITEIGDEIPVISIPEPSPSKSDLRSAFEIFSEITEITEKQSPVLQTLISSAKLLSGEGGRLNATHVRTLDFSPKKNKEKGGSQVKTDWQKKFNEEFPNRRASPRIKKLRGISMESKNSDIVHDNRSFENNASEDEGNTEKENAHNDNCLVSSQLVTNEIINKTIQDVCTNKPVASEMANVVLKAMEEAITIKSLNNTLSTVSEMSPIADICEKVQTDNLCASMPEVLIDAEDGMCNTKLSPVLTNASKSPLASKYENVAKTTSSESVPSVEHGLSAKNKKCSDNNSDLVANPPAGEEVLDNKKSSSHNSNLTANPFEEKEPENTTTILNTPSDEKLLHQHEYFPESDISSSSSDLPDINEYLNLPPKQNDPQIKSHVSKSIPFQGQTDEFISGSKKEHFGSNLQKSENCPSILKTSETSRKGKRNADISTPEKSNSLCKDDKLKKSASSCQVLTDEERLLKYATRDKKHCSNISKFSSLKDKHLIDKSVNTLAEKVGQVVEQTFSKSPVSEASNMQPELVSRKHKPSVSVNKNKKISNKLPYQKSNQTFSYSNANVNPNGIRINDKTNLTLHKEKKKTSDATATKCHKKFKKNLTYSGTDNKCNEKPYQGGKEAASEATSSKCPKKLEKNSTASGVNNKLSGKLHHSEKQAISYVASSKYLEKQENDLKASEVNDGDKPHSEKQATSPSFHGRISSEINDSNSTVSCKGRNVNISTGKSTNYSSEVPSSVKEHTKLTSGSVTLQPVFESVVDHNKSVDCTEKSNMEIISENEKKESLSQSLTDEKSQETKKLNTEFNANEPVNGKCVNPKDDDAATKVLSNQVLPNPQISKAADLSTSHYSQSVSKNPDDLNEISASVSNNQNSHDLSEVSKSSKISNLSNNLNSGPQHDKIIDENLEIMNSQVQTSKVDHMKSPKNLNLENTIASAQSNSISPPQTNIVPPLKKRIKPVQIGSPSHRSCLPGSPFMPEEHTVCIDSPSNLSLRKDTCSNAGISTCDTVNVHTLSENADSKYKNFTPPKQKYSFQKPLSGKPKAMTEFYRNAIPERSSSVPISPGSISSSSCTLDSFLAKRQLELLTLNANSTQAKEIENVLNSESFNEKQKLIGSVNTSSTFSSLSDTFMSPDKTDADTLLTPPQRRKRKRPVKMLSSPEPTPEKLPLKPENQESQHLIADSFVNIKSLHSSPVKCMSVARNLATKSIFHKKMEQNPNMPAGVKMPPKWNISKISSYTDDIFNSHSSSKEKRKNEKEPFKSDGKIRRSRPSLKVKSAFKARSAVKQKCASEKNLTKSEILCDKSLLDSDKNSEKSDMQECKKMRVSRTNSNSSSKSKITDKVQSRKSDSPTHKKSPNKSKIIDKVQSRKSDSPTHKKSPNKSKILNNTQKGKLAKATKTSETADVFVYKEPDFSFQNANSKMYNRKEYQSVSKNVCAEQVNQHVSDPEKMQVPSVSESAHELLGQTHEAPTERSSEDENELAQAIAFITSNPTDNESMLIDDPDKEAENRLDAAIQEPSSLSPLKQKSLCGDVPEPERNVEAEKMNANSLRNEETEEMAICTEQSESVNSAVTEETAVCTEQAESVSNAEKEERLDEQAKIDYLLRIIKEHGVENVLNILRRKP